MAGPGGGQLWLLQPPTPRKSLLTDTQPRARVSDAAETIAGPVYASAFPRAKLLHASCHSAGDMVAVILPPSLQCVLTCIASWAPFFFPNRCMFPRAAPGWCSPPFHATLLCAHAGVQADLLCRWPTFGRTAERRATGGQVARRPPLCLPYPVTVGVPSSTRPARGRCVQERRRPPAPLKAVPFRGWRSMCVACLRNRSPLVSQNFSLPLSDRRADSVGWRLARPGRRIV
ncbi:hypothetical protein chiPu_0026237, partial [Chiloscyllium punctatum]|nr:hypothetical protein [Chiloscyllium punctatum]